MQTNNNSIDTIKDQYQNLPQELKDAIVASDWNNKVKEVSDKNSLLIDQMGQLQNEVLFVMLGLEPASDFESNIIDTLGVSRSKAQTITKDINDIVLRPIKTHLREWEEKAKQAADEEQSSQDLSTLEQAGNFTIEPESNDRNEEEPNISHTDKDKILDDIENPTLGHQEEVNKVPEKATKENHTEPLVNQLLTGSTSPTEKKVAATVPNNLPIGNPTIFEKSEVIQAPTQKEKPVTPQKPPEPPQKPKGPDPYREMIT